MSAGEHFMQSPRNRKLSVSLIFITLLSIISLSYGMSHAAKVTLAWDANADSVAGYKLYYGYSSRNYTANVNVGNVTTYSWDGLADGKSYYFAATAYDSSSNNSDYSEELVCHTITVANTAGGTVSPSSTVFVSNGDSQTFTITPTSGYKVSDVLVDGVSIGAVVSYTFASVTAPRAISVTFAPINCTITSSVSGSGGSITPLGTTTVSSGGGQSYTITPSSGYKVSGVTVNGASVGAVTSYTFSGVTSNQTIVASFTPITYTITSSVSGSGGSITPLGSTTVSSGGGQSYKITPDTGYKVKSVLVNGSSVGAVTSYAFSGVTSSQTIVASFTPITYTITSSVSGSGGTITPLGTTTVNSGSSQAYEITPNSGYTVSDVVVNGSSAGSVKTYTFSNVTSNQTIVASFKAYDAPPVADAGPDQKVAEGILVTLKGSNSNDAEKNIVSYAWEQLEGPTVQLSSKTVADPTFKAPDVGPGGTALTFRLTVTDGAQQVATDTCIVNVTWVNLPPVAKAGPDQTVSEYASVILDGSLSTDPDDGIASYLWKQTSGPAVTVAGLTQPGLSFVTPDVGSGGATLVFELTVTDVNGLKATDSCIVNVSWVNTPPVANAGPDKTAYAGDTVALDGSGSTDDVGIVTYRWKQTQGTPVTFDPALANLKFTAPTISGTTEVLVFTLTVTDANGLQSGDSCNVTIKKKDGIDLSGAWTSSSYDGSYFKGIVAVKNTGNVKAGSFKVVFYLSSDGVTRTRYLKSASITGLYPGASKSLLLNTKNTAAKGQYYLVVVDSTSAVNELDETNNTAVVAVPAVSSRK